MEPTVSLAGLVVVVVAGLVGLPSVGASPARLLRGRTAIETAG